MGLGEGLGVRKADLQENVQLTQRCDRPAGAWEERA